jgi:membrane protease YdiL (CAAX protease family)
MGQPHWLDLIVIGLIVLVPRRISGRSVSRRFLEGTPAEADPLRQTFILANAVKQLSWLAFLVPWWVWTGRPWSALGLRRPEGSPLWIGVGIAVAVAALLGVALIMAASGKLRGPASPQSLNAKLTPRTWQDVVVWLLVGAPTASFCEELTFRAYLIWILRPLLGPWGALVVAALIFGALHVGHDLRERIPILIGGLIFGATYVVTGPSLWFAALVHYEATAGGPMVGWVARRCHRSQSAPMAISG